MIIYFPKAPSYAAISPEQKSNFLYSLSADENTIKVDSIVMKGEALLEELIQEYKFRSFFTRYPLFGMIIYYSDLWKTLAFYLVSMVFLWLESDPQFTGLCVVHALKWKSLRQTHSLPHCWAILKRNRI